MSTVNMIATSKTKRKNNMAFYLIHHRYVIPRKAKVRLLVFYWVKMELFCTQISVTSPHADILFTYTCMLEAKIELTD